MLAALALGVLLLGPDARGALRDDTAALQARLDQGGSIFLPKLPGGRCYSTRGLWVSRDGTTLTSDGACIVALGPGEARLGVGTPRPVRANAVFFVNHSNVRAPQPVRVTIRGLRITVPAARRMHGVAVFGHETTIDNVVSNGAPLTNVLVGAGKMGDGGFIGRTAITNSTLSGAQRSVISVFGPIGLRIERNTISGARRSTRAQAGAGVQIRSADRGQPVLDVRVADNTIVRNAGPGVLFELAPANGLPVLASGIEISGNRVQQNARRARSGQRAGIVVAGRQRDGRGTIVLRDNAFSANAGKQVLRPRVRTRTAVVVPRSIAPANGTTPRDDTAWLQARLDRGGGTIFLPRLANGECYATKGLWVSHDNTSITSDGACIVSLGLGPVRLRSIDGDPIASSAVFFVNRSDRRRPAPVNVRIENLRIVVPEGQGMFGVAVFGHEVTLNGLDISGAPKDDITISGRGNGNGYAAKIEILGSRLSGAARNAVSATSVIGLRIEGNTIRGVRDSPPGQPAAGIDIEPDDRGQPALDAHIVSNTISDNAGPGILLELEPNEGPAVLATALEIRGNTIVRNALKRSPPKRAGIVLAGGQDGALGTLVLRDNVVRGNGGPGILQSRLRLLVDADGNDVAGNEG